MHHTDVHHITLDQYSTRYYEIRPKTCSLYESGRSERDGLKRLEEHLADDLTEGLVP